MSPVLQQIHEIYKLVLHRDGKQVKIRSNLSADQKNVNAIISRWLGSNPSSINFSRNTVSLTEQICANQTPICGQTEPSVALFCLFPAFLPRKLCFIANFSVILPGIPVC